MPLRRSRIETVELLAYDGRVARVDLRVSSGTYIRAIADALGGHCRTLRRTEVGPFSVVNADSECIHRAADALPFLPLVEVDQEAARALRAGRAIAREGDGRARVTCGSELVAVARAGGGVLRPETVMPA